MNFKKYVLTASLVCLGAVGCASHPAPVAVNPPPPPAVVVVAPAPVAQEVAPAPVVPVTPVTPADPLLASGDGWSLRVPDENWELSDKDSLPPSILALAQNGELPARAMLMCDTFPGDQAAFVALVAKGAAENGAKTTKPVKATINGNDFATFSIVDAKLHVQTWLLVKNGNGYAFMCGTSSANTTVSALCKQVASTITID